MVKVALLSYGRFMKISLTINSMHNGLPRTGSKLWVGTGVPICTASGIQKHASVTGDGNGGFIAVWRDERDIYSDLYMQHIGADGTPIWEQDGIPLCTAGGHQDKPFIVKTENGQFFVAWLDYREDFGEESSDAIYGQLIDLEGKLLWDKDGGGYLYEPR